MFVFLLNYACEFLQALFLEEMTDAPHREVTKSCTVAAVGDAAPTVLAYRSVDLFARNRSRIMQATPPRVTGFVLAGVVLTTGIEKLGTDLFAR